MTPSVALLLLLSSTATGQQAPLLPKMTGTGVVFGTVVADATGRPVPAASVTAIITADTATFTKSTTTDRLGRFVLTGLAAGQVRLSASASGYLGGVVGQSGPDDTTGAFVPIAPSQIIEPVTLRLRRGGVISGTLLDEAGDPLGGVNVQAYRRVFGNGRRTYAQGSVARTDDRGAYRIATLLPGTYLVGVVSRTLEADIGLFEQAASTGRGGGEAGAAIAGFSLGAPGDAGSRMFIAEGGSGAAHLVSAGSPVAPPSADGTPRGYLPTFYPGGAAGVAQPIAVASGEERGGVVFQLSSAPLGRIAGRILGPTAVPPDQTTLTLVSAADEGVQYGDTITALVGATGQFLLTDVPIGAYRIEARSGFGGPSAPGGRLRIWGAATTSVGEGGASQVVVQMREGVSFSGIVRFEGAAPAPVGAALSAWSVSLSSASSAPSSLSSSSAASVLLDPSRRFAFTSALVPGDYRVRVGNGLPAPWAFSSMTIAGREVVDSLLNVTGDSLDDVVITLSDRRTELTGSVTDQSGSAVSAATVVVFPRDAALRVAGSRWLASTRPLTDGRYQIRDLPPGEYFVAVVSSLERGQASDPEWLATLQPTATRMTLAAAERRRVDLQVSGK